MSIRRYIRNTVLGTVAIATATLGLGLSTDVADAAPAAPTSLAAAITATPLPAAAPSWNPRLTKLVAEARKLTTMGIPYSMGGHGSAPAAVGSSVDCSGLTRALYFYAFGVDIGSGTGDSMVRTSGLFTRTDHPVPGDVILLGHGGSGPAYHAMVYVGNDDGYPTAVGSPDYGYNIMYQHPHRKYWAGDVMGFWHYNGATAADSLPLTPPHVNVKGGLDSVVSTATRRFTVTGWSLDPQGPTKPTTVRILVDGRVVATVADNQPNAGVNRAFHVSGNHGFRATLAVPAGKHTVSMIADPNSAYSYPLRSAGQTVNVQGGPVNGQVDRVAATPDTITVTGWTLDGQKASSAQHVYIWVDGRRVFSGVTAATRHDVNRVFQTSGRHGFSVKIHTTPGMHTVRVQAEPAAGSTNKPKVLIKGSRVAVPSYRTAGHATSVTAGSTGITVKGVASDPQHSGSSNSVGIYLNGRLTTTVVANGPKHSFTKVIALKPGRYNVTLKSNALRSNSVQTNFYNSLVTVPVIHTTGHVDGLTADTATLKVAGWAFDPQQSGRSSTVTVSVDGKAISTVGTSVARADVNGTYRVTGTHGFSLVLPGLKPGAHTISVKSNTVTGRNSVAVILGATTVVVDAPVDPTF